MKIDDIVYIYFFFNIIGDVCVGVNVLVVLGILICVDEGIFFFIGVGINI